jgi:hypothetical protein
LLVGIFSPREDDGANFGCIWISNSSYWIPLRIESVYVFPGHPQNKSAGLFGVVNRSDSRRDLILAATDPI